MDRRCVVLGGRSVRLIWTSVDRRAMDRSELVARYKAGERGFSRAHFSFADLSSADLRGIDLSGAKLLDVDLCGAKLAAADLSWASLLGANLEGARVTTEQLARPRSIKGAILPDGTR